jgi:hypothetical protein
MKPMNQNNGRRFGLLDVIILVAATGIGLAFWRGLQGSPVWTALPSDSLQWYWFQALGTITILVPLSLALLVLALRPPRPRLRRVARRPAPVVGLAALLVLALNVVVLLTVMGLLGRPYEDFTNGKNIYFCRLVSVQAGMAIALTWSVQALGGCYRRQANWLDVFGWVIGACWISLAVASSFWDLL